MKHDQFTLPFLDTTIVAEGFGLYDGFPTAKSSAHAQINVEPEEAELLDAPVPTKPSLPAQDYRLAGDCCLAEGWKARAEDNLAAIRLMTTIESEARHARPDEQERLARFTGFGAPTSPTGSSAAPETLSRPPGKISASNSKGSSRATTSPTSSGPPNTPITRPSS
jgi:hypothetical protein